MRFIDVVVAALAPSADIARRLNKRLCIENKKALVVDARILIELQL